MTAFFYFLHLATKQFKSSVTLANDFCEKKGSDVTRVRGILFFCSEVAIFIYAVGSSRLQKYSRNS
jgi:hypothetical protein